MKGSEPLCSSRYQSFTFVINFKTTAREILCAFEALMVLCSVWAWVVWAKRSFQDASCLAWVDLFHTRARIEVGQACWNGVLSLSLTFFEGRADGDLSVWRLLSSVPGKGTQCSVPDWVAKFSRRGGRIPTASGPPWRSYPGYPTLRTVHPQVLHPGTRENISDPTRPCNSS